eukprot:717532-Amphidinium_carterae.1
MPIKLLKSIENSVTDIIARMLPSGSVPVNRFSKMRNCVTCLRPVSGSIPVKLFLQMLNTVTASIARMPPSGSAPAKPLVAMENP